MVRSCLMSMNVLDVLWSEAVNHAVYVLNRVNAKALKESTLYEMWTGRKPQVRHLRVFGCVTYMRITKSHSKKLDERSKRVMHLGIEKRSKAYRLLDSKTGTMFMSRDVVFEENQKWSWETSKKIKPTPGMSFTMEGFDFDQVNESEDKALTLQWVEKYHKVMWIGLKVSLIPLTHA